MQDMGNAAQKASQEESNVVNFTSLLAQSSMESPAALDERFRKAQKQEVAKQLLYGLQVSLDINVIIDQFLERISVLLPVEGITYQNPELDVEYATPIKGRHKAVYLMDFEEEELGVIMFHRTSRFKEAELQMLETLIPTLFYPLRNAIKYLQVLRLSTTDKLTGCGNRSAMDAALAREIDLANRNESPLSAIMFDFDHFKPLNDSYGHQCGDQVLQEAIGEVKRVIRKTDLVFRYGGEEFLILLHKTNAQEAALVAEKIRQAINAMTIEYKGQQIDISASFGASDYQEGESSQCLLERTDEALYQAKSEGRNCVRVNEYLVH